MAGRDGGSGGGVSAHDEQEPMQVDQLASLLTGAHVGDARHTISSSIEPLSASAVQEQLLLDEDMIEGILFSATGRVSRPDIFDVSAASKSVALDLRNAQCVCRAWRAAAVRPLIVAMLDEKMARFRVSMEFFGSRRNHAEESRPAKTAVAGAALVDRDALRWLITGWENGLNSIVADDPSLDSVAPCAGIIKHLNANRIHGPFLIIAPEATWPSWRSALGVLPASRGELPILETRTAEEIQSIFAEWSHARQAGVALVPLHPRLSPGLASTGESEDWYAEYTHSVRAAAQLSKYVVLDERARQYGVPGFGGDLNSLLDFLELGLAVHQGNFVRVTNQPLPGTVSQLHGLLDQLHPGLSQTFDVAEVERALRFRCAAACGDDHPLRLDPPNWPTDHRAQQLFAWATASFLVPAMQAALSRVMFLRRLANPVAGRPPRIVYVEPPRGQVGFVPHDSTHYLVGRHVAVAGLKSQPQLNGRVGYVHGFDEKTERFEVLLQAVRDPLTGVRDESTRKWVKIKNANLVDGSKDKNLSSF